MKMAILETAKYEMLDS